MESSDEGESLEDLGYELSGTIEFYERPETSEVAFRVFTSQSEQITDGQQLLLIAHQLLEGYLESERH